MMSQVDSQQTLSTSQLSKRLGIGLSITFLKGIGAKPAWENRIGAQWRVADVPEIIYLICAHLAAADAVLTKEK